MMLCDDGHDQVAYDETRYGSGQAPCPACDALTDLRGEHAAKVAELEEHISTLEEPGDG
jgi:hypothetical protein